MRREERGDDACRHQGYEWDEQRKHQAICRSRGLTPTRRLGAEKWTPEDRHQADGNGQEGDPAGLRMEAIERDFGETCRPMLISRAMRSAFNVQDTAMPITMSSSACGKRNWRRISQQ